MAAAKRLFKADFVNQSNIGFGGEFIDFGAFSFVNGFVPGLDGLGTKMYHEVDFISGLNKKLLNRYNYSIGFYLLNQMGIEEDRLVRTIQKNRTVRPMVEQLAKSFIDLVYSQNKVANVASQDNWKWQDAEGNVKLQFAFKEIVAQVLMNSQPGPKDTDTIIELVRRYTETPTDTFEAKVRPFAESLSQLIRTATHDISDKVSYAYRVQQIATFKNRNVWVLSRPDLLHRMTEIAAEYQKTPKRDHFQKVGSRRL